MRAHRPTRRREHGQTLAIIAIASTALLGVTALAVDYGVNTTGRRTLQNATDSAALAGASDLNTPTPTQANRKTGATSALDVLHNHMGWPSWGTWATDTVNSRCSDASTVCQFTVTAPAPESNVTITVNTPPKAPDVYAGQANYFEVSLSQTGRNGFAGVIGSATGTQAARSVAYHFAGNQGFGFALYADTTIQTGNAVEVIAGNTYAGRSIAPQANGQAGLCADQGGALVFGAPQFPDSGYNSKTDPGQYDTRAPAVQSVASCAGVPGGTVSETSTPGTCPNTVQGINISQSGSWNTVLGACEVSPPITPPVLESPTLCWSSSLPCTQTTPPPGALISGEYQPGWYQGTGNGSVQTGLTVDHPLAPGLYEIKHNSLCSPPNCYDLVIGKPLSNCSAYPGHDACLVGVTFILDPGATMNVTSNGSGTFNVLLTPYAGPAGTLNPADGRYPIYAAPGSATTVLVDKNGTDLVMTGTVYMPDGSFTVDTNAFTQITGQAIVKTWNVQSGYHPNPDITYDGGRVAPQAEILRLAE